MPAIEGAWVRLNAVPGRPAAAYMTVRGAREDATIARASTPIAARAELHETMAGGHGGMTMAALPSVAVPAGGEVRFAPGGRHIMLFDVTPATRADTAVPIVLTLADGRELHADAEVVAAGDPAPR